MMEIVDYSAVELADVLTSRELATIGRSLRPLLLSKQRTRSTNMSRGG